MNEISYRDSDEYEMNLVAAIVQNARQSAAARRYGHDSWYGTDFRDVNVADSEVKEIGVLSWSETEEAQE